MNTFASARPSSPEILEDDAPDHVRAEWWRSRYLKMSRAALADRLGLHLKTIQNYEEGSTPIPATYRMALGALIVGVIFDWRRASLPVNTLLTIDGRIPVDS